MIGDRERILASLPSLGVHPREAQEPHDVEAEGPLWPLFESRLSALGARMATLEDLQELRGRTAWVDEDAGPHAEGLGLARADDIWSAEVGVTLAECAVAESGSVLIENAPGRRRLASLAPEIHVVFVREQDIVGTIAEALTQLEGRSAALITGASRTADIEGVLVRGVHGPREVWIVRLERN